MHLRWVQEKPLSKKDLLLGLAIGAAAAYLADPRRATWRRAGAWGAGFMAATRRRWRDDNDDRHVIERVRAKLDQTSSRAQSIHATSTEYGSVVWSGRRRVREVSRVRYQVACSHSRPTT
jgi:hypothetical protein